MDLFSLSLYENINITLNRSPSTDSFSVPPISFIRFSAMERPSPEPPAATGFPSGCFLWPSPEATGLRSTSPRTEYPMDKTKGTDPFTLYLCLLRSIKLYTSMSLNSICDFVLISLSVPDWIVLSSFLAKNYHKKGIPPCHANCCTGVSLFRHDFDGFSLLFWSDFFVSTVTSSTATITLSLLTWVFFLPNSSSGA